MHCLMPVRMSSDFRIRPRFCDNTEFSNKRSIGRLISIIRNIIGQWITCTFGRTWNQERQLVRANVGADIIVELDRRGDMVVGVMKRRSWF